jgi:SAM-dependent methyltransferase
MPLGLAAWHARFLRQASWTRELRIHLYRRAGLALARRILEVGAATGALTSELNPFSRAGIHGLDRDRLRLAFAHQADPATLFCQGDAQALPYRSGSFDATLAHFLLMWVEDPARTLREMKRVTRPGGAVLALAEPDYGGRVDFPLDLVELGRAQREALLHQGAKADVGRELASLFAAAGLKDVEVGVLGAQWAGPPAREEFDSEWAVLEADLGGSVAERELARLRALDWAARERGTRVLYVPTFYAFGRAD